MISDSGIKSGGGGIEVSITGSLAVLCGDVATILPDT